MTEKSTRYVFSIYCKLQVSLFSHFSINDVTKNIHGVTRTTITCLGKTYIYIYSKGYGRKNFDIV